MLSNDVRGTFTKRSPSPRSRWNRSRATLGVLISLSAFGFTFLSLVGVSNASADTLQISSDNLETGWYPNEPQLTPSAVANGSFGQLFNTLLIGQVYAQPLIAQPTVLAVTEKDYAYGLNSASGQVTWQRNFGTPADPLAQTSCGDIGANMGITGTPVIDSSTGIAYFVAATGGINTPTQFFMDAVNVQTGATPVGWPTTGVPIQGHADNDPGSVFNGQWQTQRPGLILVNGVVYAAFSSQCDYGSWDGWLIGVSTTSHNITTMWASETGSGGGGRAGIWQSGSAPVVDSQGNIYFSTGNGTLPSGPALGSDTTVHNLGEAVVELSASSGTLQLSDFFIPADAANLNSYDGDLGSGGGVALPPSMSTPQEPNVLLQVGKEGVLYALNMNSLGGYQQGPSGGDAVLSETSTGGGVWSKPALWPGDGGYLYLPTAGNAPADMGGGALDAFKEVISGTGVISFNLVGSTYNSGYLFGFGSGKPIITSNGTTSGSALLWVTHTADASGAGGELQAYNPIPQNPGAHGTLTEVWHAALGSATKFSEPAVDNGDVYVGAKNGTSDGALIGFGILTSGQSLSGATVDFSPTVVSQTATSTATFTATSPTTISSFTPTGSAFTIGTPSQTLPATLSTGQTITVPVTFTPDGIGTLSGTLTANHSGPTAVATLNGQGLAATTPLNASPASADFTLQPIGGPLVSQLVTFTNVSSSPVSITGFNTPVLPFTVPAPPANATLNPGDTVSFTVDFSPPGSSGSFVQSFNGVATLATNVGNFGVPVSGSAAPPTPPTPPSSGGGGGTPPPSVQATLTITTIAGQVGTPLPLATSGDDGGGALTYNASNGTATGCAIAGGTLSAASAGTCVVVATKAANTTNPSVSSPSTIVTFIAKVSTAGPVSITVSFIGKSSALSAESKKALKTLASKLSSGATVTITGFAKDDAALAKARAKSVANYLASFARIRVTLKTSTSVAVARATVSSANR
ncbi:MAG TPA: hypothetical protein VGZ04_11970 [Acidimicrobiales bacterium]|jgi:hypothetical protein|nr:hypothetical protein [Acidimicrobiales bacterium]